MVYGLLFIMWIREHFTDLQYIIAESTRVAIFEWWLLLCRLSSVTSETAHVYRLIKVAILSPQPYIYIYI